ncbi:jg9348 [Pararge aegeria aegeria]|uniref:Jg9348 protein n=1 Tax=Pararge aegeria aegeria TaxID=348720 RepID=A0A8S4S1E2_9NEOP|nr:jg9348 [Pararge aegeria aegeria]
MRIDTIVALALTMALVIAMRCSEAARLRGLSLTEEEEDIPRHRYREYGVLRSRAARADDSFDDYGHLRFGRRSED